MAKVGEVARKRYQERIREYKTAVVAILAEEKMTAPTLAKGDFAQTDKRLMLSGKSLNLVSYYTLKNEALLNDARKCLYKAIIYLEDIVSNYVDCPFSDYENGVYAVDEVLGDKEKFDLIRKIGYSIDCVKEGFGTNSKWKWSFVEIEGRFTTVTKNLLNFKTLIERLDPNHKSSDPTIRHIDLTRKRLQDSADSYREKYELTTRRPDDMQIGINYLAALRRVHMLLGEAEEAEAVKRKVDVWQHKLTMDMKGKKREQAGRPRAE